MHDLEQTLREELAQLAEEVEARAPLAQRARTGRRRHRTRRLAVGAAAAVLVAAVGVGAALYPTDSDAPPSAGAPSSRASDQAPTVPGGYRLEVWQDVGLYVPETWGWGGAPGACGAGPTVGSDGRPLSGGEHAGLDGYVGRPIAQTGSCSSDRPATTMPYVWLGADVPVGTVHLGHGRTQETRTVAGVAVTVASADPTLRAQILASAHRVALDACPARLASPPDPSGGDTPAFTPISLQVCAYDSVDGTAAGAATSGYRLLYADELAADAAEELMAAVASAPPLGEFSCFGASGGEWALLHVAGAGDLGRDYVVDLSCPGIADETGVQHRLTTADVAPWATGGINAVLHGNPLIDAPGLLVGG